MRFSPVRGINLIPYTVCKSRLCRRILSRLRADLRENPTKQWASRDTLIQSAGSISNSARYHSDANIALGPILKMYIPGQIRISNALNSDGYSTGNAPPSGNNTHPWLPQSSLRSVLSPTLTPLSGSAQRVWSSTWTDRFGAIDFCHLRLLLLHRIAFPPKMQQHIFFVTISAISENFFLYWLRVIRQQIMSLAKLFHACLNCFTPSN